MHYFSSFLLILLLLGLDSQKVNPRLSIPWRHYKSHFLKQFGWKKSAKSITINVAPPLEENGKFVYRVEFRCFSKKNDVNPEGTSIAEPCYGNMCMFWVRAEKGQKHKCPSRRYNVFVDKMRKGAEWELVLTKKHGFSILDQRFKYGEAVYIEYNDPNTVDPLTQKLRDFFDNVDNVSRQKSKISKPVPTTTMEPPVDRTGDPNYVTIKIAPPPGHKREFKYKIWLKCFLYATLSDEDNMADYNKLSNAADQFEEELENPIGKSCYGTLCSFAVNIADSAGNLVHQCPSNHYELFVIIGKVEMKTAVNYYHPNDREYRQRHVEKNARKNSEPMSFAERQKLLASPITHSNPDEPRIFWTFRMIEDGGEYKLRHYI